MHSTELGEDITAHHNGDFSGNVIFRVPSELIIDEGTVSLPFTVLRELVFSYLRNTKISRLENMDDEQLLEHFLDCE
jgi:hypothetical protein